MYTRTYGARQPRANKCYVGCYSYALVIWLSLCIYMCSIYVVSSMYRVPWGPIVLMSLPHMSPYFVVSYTTSFLFAMSKVGYFPMANVRTCVRVCQTEKRTFGLSIDGIRYSTASIR